MIDLTQKSLPNTVMVGGRDFSIYTDYRIWLRFSIEYEAWVNGGMKGALDIQYMFKNDIPVFETSADYNSIFLFAFPQNVIPHSEDGGGSQVLFYQYDGDYIYSAFLQQYGIDLIDVKELHWWKFKALMNGISQPTKLAEIMGYRAYTGEDSKDMKALYRKIKESWMPPVVETEEEKAQEDTFNSMFD